MASAVIIRVSLPDGLESLRRRSVGDAADGVPAHVTLLYPFVEWDRLNPHVGREIAAVASRHDPIPHRLTGPHRWPEVIYAGLEPAEPFARLQADLAAAFPSYPIYGHAAGFAYVPHVTVAQGAAALDPRTIEDPAWASLTRTAMATHLEVIATDGGAWDLVWRIPLGPRGRKPRV